MSSIKTPHEKRTCKHPGCGKTLPGFSVFRAPSSYCARHKSKAKRYEPAAGGLPGAARVTHRGGDFR